MLSQQRLRLHPDGPVLLVQVDPVVLVPRAAGGPGADSKPDFSIQLLKDH